MPKKTKINPSESVTVTLKKFNMYGIRDNTTIFLSVNDILECQP